MRLNLGPALDRPAMWYAAFGARLALGSILAVAAIGKLPEQAEFVELVKSVYILPWPLNNWYPLVLPWAELVLAVLLLAGLLTRVAAALSLPMILSFIIFNAQTLTFPPAGCPSCFGDIILLPKPVALALDCAMLIMALIVLCSKQTFMALDSFRPSLADKLRPSLK